MENSYSVKNSRVVLHRPNFYTTKEFIEKDLGFAYGIKILIYINIFLCFLSCFSFGINMSVFMNTSLAFLAVLMFMIFLSNDKQDNNKEVIIKNNEKEEYMLCLGNEVRKFYGDAVKSSRVKGNQTRPILVNAETVKRHFLCMATIGAGKSVLMKGLIEQHALLGGGCLIVDGKGTDEFAKEIYGLVASLGREDDFIHLNFLDMDNTHTINPLLSGSALSIYEILIALLIGEENEWKAKQKEFMKNILKLMVYKRDNEKDFLFNFSSLTSMMNLSTLVKEAIEYKHLALENSGIRDFVLFVSSSIGEDYNDFLKGNKDDKEWVAKMMKASQNTDLQGVYDASMSAGAWRGVITNLSSDYGKVFNVANPSISLWEATQKNKIIFVTLPTMDSDTTPKELGRLILGLIKGVAAQKAKYAREPKIPFICFLDELGSYVVEGFGRLESKSRSLGMSIFPFFQSPAQIDVLSKNDYERKEIIDVTGVHILMKNMHPETTEFYAKMIEKETVISKDYTQKVDFHSGQGSAEANFKTEEKDAIMHNEVVNMNNGEMIVFANGKMHKAVARAESSLLNEGKKTTYMAKSSDKIPLTQYISKQDFFTEVAKYMNNPIMKDIFKEAS